MKSRHKFIALAALPLLLIITCTVFAQDTLSLTDCFRYIQTVSPEAHKYDLERRLGELRTRINTLSYYPQASLQGKATWQSDVVTIPLEIPGAEFPSPDQDQYAVSLEIRQNLYDGGTTRAKHEVIGKEYEVALLRTEAELHSAEDMVIDLFYRIAVYDQLITSTELHIDQLRNTISVLERRHENGVAEKKDVLAAQIGLKELLQRRKEASTYKEAARASLAILMDRDTTFEIAIADDPFASLLVSDFSKHPGVRTLNAQIELLEKQEKQNRTQYRPQLFAFANLSYGKPGLNFLGSEFDTYTTAGVLVNIPLAHFYLGKSQREQEVFTLQAEKLRLEQKNLLQNISSQEQQSAQEIMKLTTWLAEDDEIVSLRKQLLDILQTQLNEGVALPVDYLNALDDFAIAEEQRITHRILLQREEARLWHLSQPSLTYR